MDLPFQALLVIVAAVLIGLLSLLRRQRTAVGPKLSDQELRAAISKNLAFQEWRRANPISMGELLLSPDKMHDIKAIFDQPDAPIIEAYSAVLAADTRPLHPESSLPFPREEIRRALTAAISRVRDPETRANLQTELSGLDWFIADAQVPTDPEENAKAFTALLRQRASEH